MNDGTGDFAGAGQHRSNADAASGAVSLARRSPDDTVASLNMFRCWQRVRKWWWVVGLATVASVVATIAYTLLLANPIYQATAVIEPVSRAPSRLSSLAAQFDGSDLLSMLPSGLGGGQSAEQYIAILNSYAFTISLVEKYNLAHYLTVPGRTPRRPPSSWHTYQALNSQFDGEFDRKSGTIKLTYTSGGAQAARRVLDAYIDGLREKLRLQEIQEATVALNSLKDEAAKTPDPLLQNDIYLLVAKQIARQRMAQVQADFAFVVIDPPFVPDKPYRPRPLLDGVLAAFLGAMFSSVAAAGIEMLWRLRADFRQIGHAASLGAVEFENSRAANL